jgi:polyhydroxyalkanoate synthase
LLPWNAHLAKPAADLIARLDDVSPDDFTKAVRDEAQRRQLEFSAGMEQYRSYRRAPARPRPDVVWQSGTTRLLDFGTGDASIPARPLLIVPSLINRYHVLDIAQGHRSFIGALRDRGFRPYVIDWDSPGKAEENFDLSAYIIQRLEPALDHIISLHNNRVAIIGYCMGGLLSLALAFRKPDATQGLALLATPWDFHVGHDRFVSSLRAMQPQINTMIDTLGCVPVDILQAMFTSLSPWASIDKFRRFSRMANQTDEHIKRRDLFVELEDWLNNGSPLSGPAARECLNDWYINNTPAKGLWSVAGVPVLPQQIACPSLAIIPQHDTIVPPGSARAILGCLPGVETITVNKGHIGMVTGDHSRESLINPLTQWLSGIF